MKARNFVLLLIVAFFATLPGLCGGPPGPPFTPIEPTGTDCQPVAGVLMTDIYAITPGQINLGPSFGDLGGAVSAQILGQNHDGSYNVQHYWISKEGDVIKFQQAVLHPVYVPGTSNVVAVPWGHYKAYLTHGGTGKWANVLGYIDCFGMADFNELTLVLRYRGTICHKPAQQPR